jgi:hypothetical protein
MENSMELEFRGIEFNGIPLNFPWNFLWNSMEFHQPHSIEFYKSEVDGIPWKIPWNSMEFHGIPWNFVN